jgi:hypothetical protein
VRYWRERWRQASTAQSVPERLADAPRCGAAHSPMASRRSSRSPRKSARGCPLQICSPIRPLQICGLTSPHSALKIRHLQHLNVNLQIRRPVAARSFYQSNCCLPVAPQATLQPGLMQTGLMQIRRAFLSFAPSRMSPAKMPVNSPDCAPDPEERPFSSTAATAICAWPIALGRPLDPLLPTSQVLSGGSTAMDVQRFLIGLGLVILVARVIWPILSRIGLGRLPGDIMFERRYVLSSSGHLHHHQRCTQRAVLAVQPLKGYVHHFRQPSNAVDIEPCTR